MKKSLPYILIIAVLAAIAVLITTRKNSIGKRFNKRISFRIHDKIPYGSYVAFKELKYLFPQSGIYINTKEPGYWDSISVFDTKQALIIIAPNFLADENEMKKLLLFVSNGNDVFISAREISDAAEKILHCKTSIFRNASLLQEQEIFEGDSLTLSLYHPPYPEYSTYVYPGVPYHAWAYESDTTITEIWGGDELNHANFLHLKTGEGNLYVHLAPIAFSNYFLLHSQNMEYLEKVFSVISPEVKKVVWDEYYLKRSSNRDGKAGYPGWFSVLMRFPALKAALLTIMLVLLLYVLMEMRRKQRIIPVLSKPRNDSLDFVTTIGRLYLDRGDHKNLCRKMTSYFLEHIRTRYKLKTHQLDNDFIRNLHYKSGYPESVLQSIISFIHYLDGIDPVSNRQLITYHRQLETFYQNK